MRGKIKSIKLEIRDSLELPSYDFQDSPHLEKFKISHFPFK